MQCFLSRLNYHMSPLPLSSALSLAYTFLGLKVEVFFCSGTLSQNDFQKFVDTKMDINTLLILEEKKVELTTSFCTRRRDRSWTPGDWRSLLLFHPAVRRIEESAWERERRISTWVWKSSIVTSSFMYQYRQVSFRMNQYFFHFCEKYVLASFFFHSQPSQSPWPKSLQEIRLLLIEAIGLPAAGGQRWPSRCKHT